MMNAGKDNAAAVERQSLEIGKWGSLFMAVAGVAAAYLSHSDALLIDGLYSGVNFVSAIVAAAVGASVVKPADRRYPFGYGAYEALYVKFRSLVLLGIMVLAMFGAIQKIFIYATGGQVPELVFGPILAYAVLMVAVCLALAGWHHHNWRRSGRHSELLRTESKAAIIDGVLSAGAGGGLLGASLLRGTPLEVIVPVADSIVVLVMCGIIVRQPVQMFLDALREVAGEAAKPTVTDQVRTCIQETLQDRPFELLEVAVTKLGRTHFVVPYLKPEAPVQAEELDALRTELESTFGTSLGTVGVEIIITAVHPYKNAAPTDIAG